MVYQYSMAISPLGPVHTYILVWQTCLGTDKNWRTNACLVSGQTCPVSTLPDAQTFPNLQPLFTPPDFSYFPVLFYAHCNDYGVQYYYFPLSH